MGLQNHVVLRLAVAGYGETVRGSKGPLERRTVHTREISTMSAASAGTMSRGPRTGSSVPPGIRHSQSSQLRGGRASARGFRQAPSGRAAGVGSGLGCGHDVADACPCVGPRRHGRPQGGEPDRSADQWRRLAEAGNSGWSRLAITSAVSQRPSAWSKAIEAHRCTVCWCRPRRPPSARRRLPPWRMGGGSG